MIDTTSMGIMASMVQPTSSTMASHMISKKDSDSDSSLTLQELGSSEDFFSTIDSNEDGLASKSEIATAIDTAMSQFDGDMPSKEQFQSILEEFGFEAQSSSTSSSNSSLSSSQLDTISSVLENYDADSLTQSDAQEIVAAFKEAGIEPGTDLEAAMEEAGFSAQEVGSLAGVGSEAGGTPPPGGGGGSGGGGGGETASSEEEYDSMDLNEDGVVSADEIAEYFGTSSDETQELSSNNQNALDNVQLLMETLKVNSEDGSIDATNFNGLLKAINNQNHNSEINTYLSNDTTATMYGYA